MGADISNYIGREPAFVKHYFLEIYLESLLYKTSSKYDEFAYVDGFSGPWQSTGVDFADTSFGIALEALRKAKATWKARGKEVRMSAYLVERSAAAYAKLEAIKARFPDITIHTYNGDFGSIAPKILVEIPKGAFAFFLIDPKGWRIDIQKLAPLLKRPRSEVVFNFMFDFINRAASIDDAKVITGLTELMPHGSWRTRLAALDRTAGDHSAARKEVLADAFRETLIKVGAYEYVAEIPVLQRIKDRTLYSLFYGTRHAKGIEVFRGCHVKTERQQRNVRTATKRAHQEDKTRQPGLFGSDVSLSPDDIEDVLAEHKRAARETLIALIPVAPESTTYARVWPRVLEKHVVTRPDVNAMAADLWKDAQLLFPGWERGKRVPQDGYRVSRAA